jgi:hypothetical protein
MKKAVILFAAGLLLLASLPAFSQAAAQPQAPAATATTPAPGAQNAYPKDIYYKTVSLLKVWLHPLGYKLQFFNSSFGVSDIYVPLAWFNKGSLSKANVVYGNDDNYPYCSIFWVDGVFDHITLYVLNDFSSQTWGVLNVPGDLTAQFNVQEPPKEF